MGSGYGHAGPARVLVHRLKYQGIRRAAEVLAVRMAEVIDGIGGTLVPVPRVWARKWKYGIDPGRELALALGALTGFETTLALLAPVWAPAHAGARRERRTAIRFRAGSLPIGPCILVDDVLTTGATMWAARRVVGRSAICGVTATSAGRVVM